MQFTRDQSATLLIQSYTDGVIRAAGSDYASPIVIKTDGEICLWEPPSLDQLNPDHLAIALDSTPEILIIGTGKIQSFPPSRMVAEILRRGTGLESMTTSAACRTYNVLAAEGRRVAAALFV